MDGKKFKLIKGVFKNLYLDSYKVLWMELAMRNEAEFISA